MRAKAVAHTIVVAALSLCSLQGLTHAQSCDPAQVWERMIEAKGGRRALLRVQTLFVRRSYSWRVLLRKRTLEYRLFYRFPDFRWGWFDSGTEMFGKSVSTGNLTTRLGQQERDSAAEADIKPMRPIPAEALYADPLVYFLELGGLKPAPVRCDQSANDAIWLLTEFAGVRFAYFVSSHNYLPSSVEVTSKTFTTRHRLFEYREIGGLMVPAKDYQEPGNLKALTFTLEYEINPAYDPEIVDRKPSINAGPDAWRPADKRKKQF